MIRRGDRVRRPVFGLIWLLAAVTAQLVMAQEMNWDKVTCPNPTARSRHAVAYDAARGQVVLFGGSGGSGFLNETWVWDGTAWVQKFPATKPSGRNDFAMAYDAARGQVVLFGGVGRRLSKRHMGVGWDELGA